MSKKLGNYRVSALKRLSQPSTITNINQRSLVGSRNSSIIDARELLVNKKKSTFDARQLLSRQSSNTANNTAKSALVRKALAQSSGKTIGNNGKTVVITGIMDTKVKDGRVIPSRTTQSTQPEKSKKIFALGSSTLVTIRNNNNTTITKTNELNNQVSLTKTIRNNAAVPNNVPRLSQPIATDQQVVISIVNDKYIDDSDVSKTKSSGTQMTRSSSTINQRNSPPAIKRLHDASIQTAPASTASRAPIRINTYRHQITASTITDDADDSSEQTMYDDFYEPPIKRTNLFTRKATERNAETHAPLITTGSVKRTLTGVPISSRISSAVTLKPSTNAAPDSTVGTILATNLQSSVSEDDVIELFGKIGRINEVTTLSQGCVQIVYAKYEHAEQAVAKYHNRLLDGQLMYVCLQQPKQSSITQTKKLAANAEKEQPAREDGASNYAATSETQSSKLNASKSTSNKIVIDPAFIRQALFQSSNSSTSSVQFQVKL